jgi:hypothetical protein
VLFSYVKKTYSSDSLMTWFWFEIVLSSFVLV